eukprot:scaffold303243_cov30-Tisochrysis_lutea.AAC.1
MTRGSYSCRGIRSCASTQAGRGTSHSHAPRDEPGAGRKRSGAAAAVSGSVSCRARRSASVSGESSLKRTKRTPASQPGRRRNAHATAPSRSKHEAAPRIRSASLRRANSANLATRAALVSERCKRAADGASARISSFRSSGRAVASVNKRRSFAPPSSPYLNTCTRAILSSLTSTSSQRSARPRPARRWSARQQRVHSAWLLGSSSRASKPTAPWLSELSSIRATTVRSLSLSNAPPSATHAVRATEQPLCSHAVSGWLALGSVWPEPLSPAVWLCARWLGDSAISPSAEPPPPPPCTQPPLSSVCCRSERDALAAIARRDGIL